MKRYVAKDTQFEGKIPEAQYFDFATPYGYGGWIVEGEKTEELFRAYEIWVQKHGVISEFVRFHPTVKNYKQFKSFYEIIQLGEVVHMDLNSPEDIWNNITSKNRNMIRKAVKNDVKVYNGRFPEIYEKFRLIYNATMDKDNAEDYYYFSPEFYQSVLEDLPENAQMFWAEKNGKVIAASIIVGVNEYLDYHLSGSLSEYSSLAPTNLLLCKVALWGCTNKFRSLYLGGGVGSGKDSLFKFKRAFYKGRLNHFYIGRKIFNHDLYEKLVELRSKRS